MESVTYLTVGDGIEEFTDLGWSVNLCFRVGERMRGGQGVHTHHSMDSAQDKQVFL